MSTQIYIRSKKPLFTSLSLSLVIAFSAVVTSAATDQSVANHQRRNRFMDPEEAQYIQKLREERRKNKKQPTKAAADLSCEPILVPSPFAVPYKPLACCKVADKPMRGIDCSCDHNKPKKKHKKCKTDVKAICQKSFNGHAKNGIILDKPGVYKFEENINFYPTVERTTAITITASNVVLDLDTFTLAQGNDVRYTYGIAIARDVHNVTITGVQNSALILDFTLANVRIFGRTDTILLENFISSQTEIKQLTNDDIPEEATAFLCTYINAGISIGEGDTSDISMQGTDRNNHVNNISLKNLVAKRANYGCRMVFTFGIEVENCVFTENTVFGLLLGNYWPVLDAEGNSVFPACGNGVVRKCRFDNNNADNFDLSNPLCDPNDPDSGTFFWDYLAAIEVDRCVSFLFENCIVSNNHNTGVVLSVDHDGSNGLVWRDCLFSNNSSDFETCDGLHFSGSFNETLEPCITGLEYPFEQVIDIVVERCSSMGNYSPTSCSGFFFAFVNGARIVDCNSSGNTSSFEEGVVSNGYRIGGLEPGGRAARITFLNCTAERNGYLGGLRAAGILARDQSIQDVIVRDCVFNGNGNIEGLVTAGIIVETRFTDTNFTNVVVDNCILNNNGNDNSSFTGGIIITRPANTVPLDNVLIQNNTLTYNHGAGVGVYGDINNVVIKANEADNNTEIGFDISQVPNPVLVAKNIAYANAGGNYNGVPVNNIVDGTYAVLPVIVGESKPLHNYSITAS